MWSVILVRRKERKKFEKREREFSVFCMNEALVSERVLPAKAKNGASRVFLPLCDHVVWRGYDADVE